jgi:predicted permease
MGSDVPIWRRYLRLFGPDAEADIDDELRHHMELLAAHLMARGVSEAEAREQARRRFGNVVGVRTDCLEIAQRKRRAMARAELLDTLLQDLRFGVRGFLRTPAFTLAALLTLGVGMGANTAVFSVVNAVLLRPLPYAEPDRVTSIWTRYTRESGQSFDIFAVSVPEFREYRAATRALSHAAAYNFGQANLADGTQAADRVAMASVTSDFFAVVGVAPALGRPFEPGDDAAGAPCRVIVSDAFWRARYQASTRVLQQTLRVDGNVCSIVGVMPRDFFFPTRTVALWRPLALDADPQLANDRGSHWILAVGRLADGVTLEQARAELGPLMTSWRNADPHHLGHSIILSRFRDDLVANERTTLLVVLSGVGLVLLIICANLANLLLVRADARRREMAVRVALGAGRARLVRQMLTESLLLAICGGALALLCGPALLKLLIALNPNALAGSGPTALDTTVLLFTLAISLTTGLLFGSIPAFQVMVLRLHDTLKSEGRASSVNARSLAVRRALVVLEVALSMAVVVAAGLLVRSYQQLRAVQLGFEPRGLTVMDVTLPGGDYRDKARVQQFYHELRTRVAALPGLEAVGLTSQLPQRNSPPNDGFRIEGRREPQPGEPDIDGGYIQATPGALEALRVPLIWGRWFDQRDGAGATPVALIDETAARRFWPGQDPIGRRIQYYDDATPWLTIVGVVGTVRYESARRDVRPSIYVPHAQLPRQFYTGRDMTLLVRGPADAASVASTVRTLVRELDPAVPVSRVSAMADVVERAQGAPRFAAGLMALFGLVALLVGALGVYGLLSYVVQTRSLDIGIRMALGANAARVQRAYLAQGITLALTGIAVGALLVVASGGLLRELLFGVTATDWPTIGAVMAVLFAVSLLASWLPARRATRVDPLKVLRG